MRIALVRLDKIGDLVCTLPVDQSPDLQALNVHPWWIISMGLGFIPANAQPGRRFLQIERHRPWESFLTLVRFFRREKIEAIVSFQAPWWVSMAALIARVPRRIGVRSQWHSFLFLTHGLRQRRSLSTKHESDYNMELLAFAVKTLGGKTTAKETPTLSLRAPESEDFWSRVGLRDEGYFVVHPGMAGSAPNWPQQSYVDLIQELSAEFPIVITGTPSDEPWLSEIRRALTGNNRVRWMVGEASVTELLRILHGARVVVAPSTGVAHLAASLGRPVVGLYPATPPSQSATRWAARGPRVKILTAPPEGLPLLRVADVLRVIRDLL